MKLRRLKPEGVAQFAAFLDALRAGAAFTPPVGLLGDPTTSEPLAINVEVERRVFTNRLELARYLHDRFTAKGLKDVERDAGLWVWLSLFWFDVVCPLGNSGERKPGEQARHIPELANFQRYYRHLLAGPYMIFRAYRDNPKKALAVLCQPIHVPGEIVGQLAARYDSVTNKALMELATWLYVDPVTDKPKPGTSGKTNGAPRRLWDVMQQFDLTWDLYAASANELLGILPDEFARFRPTTA
jgi:hypothetical protein